MSFDFVPRRVKGQARARPSASSAKASSSRILAAVSASPSISTLPSQSKVEDEEGTSRIEAIAEALMEVLSPMYLDRSGNEVLSNKLKTLPPNEYLHVAHLLEHPAIWRVCKVQADVTLALHRLAELGFIEVSPNGFGLRLPEASFLGGQHKQDSRTIYVENIPPAHEGPLGIGRFISRLLRTPVWGVYPANESGRPIQDSQSQAYGRGKGKAAENSTSTSASTRIRSHAFVVLGEEAAVERAITSWPWMKSLEIDSVMVQTTSEDEITAEAKRLGLRMLSLREFLRMRDEYQAYKSYLFELQNSSRPAPTAAAVAAADTTSSGAKISDGSNNAAETVVPTALSKDDAQSSEKTSQPDRPKTPVTLQNNATFPPGLILLVRGLSSNSTKASIKAIFERIFPNSVDYVDHTEGNDTCYLRCSAPESAAALQRSSGASEGASKLKTVILTGKEEEDYWAALPKQVRKTALKRAQKISDPSFPKRGGEAENPAASSGRALKRAAQTNGAGAVAGAEQTQAQRNTGKNKHMRFGED